MKAKAFLIRMFGLILASAAIVHIFTVFIDPYQKAGINEINRLRGPNDRLNVSRKLGNNERNFEFFIVGSSRVGGFDLSLVEKFTNQKAFNYNLGNTSLEDYVAMVNHIAHTSKSKTIYLQLDFYSFKETFSTRHQIMETPLKKYLTPYIDLNENEPKLFIFFNKTYFSLRAFIDSLKTLRSYLKSIIKSGLSLEGATPEVTTSKAPAPEGPYPEVNPKPPKKPKRGKVQVLEPYFKNKYDGFVLNKTKSKKLLGFIKKITDENKIELIVAMSPMNEEHLIRFLSNKELTKSWLQVKRVIADVFESFYDFNNCSVNAFKGRLYWDDSVHPETELAEIMMRVMLNQPVSTNVPKSFGKQVNRENIDDYLFNLNKICAKG